MNEVAFLQLADDHKLRDFELLYEWRRDAILSAFGLPPEMFDPPKKTDVTAYYQCTCSHHCDGCDCICHNGSPA